ncbi:SemiSWEET transporter [Candidatus Woesearchaeota archaeon]|nr:SemiSWEET transporter [Candidatus Woesearchaeota archaeon]
MNWQIIGYIGGLCTTFCFIPQLVKAIKTKELDDFSWAYLFVLGFGVLMWLIYGIAIWDMVIISANAITMLFVLSILFMKWRFGRK